MFKEMLLVFFKFLLYVDYVNGIRFEYLYFLFNWKEFLFVVVNLEK